jgi:putative ABC transport system permease protein
MRLLPTTYAVRNLARDPGRSVQLALATALVAGLLLAAAAFSAGMRGAMGSSGDRANVILLGAGSEGSIERSSLDPTVAGIVAAEVAGLRRAGDAPAVSPEIAHMTLVGPPNGPQVQAVLRGVTPTAFAVHRGARLTAGTMPGGDALLAGRLAHLRLGLPPAALAPGATLLIEGRAFTVSGTFAAPGTVYEGELWVDLAGLMAATRRTTISTVVVAGAADGDLQSELETFAALRLDLELVAINEADYYQERGRFFAPIRAMAWLTAVLIAAGALFGGLNAYYAAFAARAREAATIQAMGFPRRAVLLAWLTEAILVSWCGTLLALVAGLACDGLAVTVPGGAFALTLDPAGTALAVAAGLAVGPLGVLLPAWRNLARPLPGALRAD